MKTSPPPFRFFRASTSSTMTLTETLLPCPRQMAVKAQRRALDRVVEAGFVDKTADTRASSVFQMTAPCIVKRPAGATVEYADTGILRKHVRLFFHRLKRPRNRRQRQKPTRRTVVQTTLNRLPKNGVLMMWQPKPTSHGACRGIDTTTSAPEFLAPRRAFNALIPRPKLVKITSAVALSQFELHPATSGRRSHHRT